MVVGDLLILRDEVLLIGRPIRLLRLHEVLYGRVGVVLPQIVLLRLRRRQIAFLDGAWLLLIR